MKISETISWLPSVTSSTGHSVCKAVKVILYLFANFRQEGELLDDFIEVLRNGTEFEQYYFECPPISNATQNETFEFILKSSSGLDRKSQEGKFNDYFIDPECLSVEFLSLSNYSLISPCPPINGTELEKQNYVHLATFARNGPTNKLKDVLKTSATALMNKVNTTSASWWFSTSGHGVAWLHVRIEPRPKKYRHDAYKRDRTDAASESLYSYTQS